MLLILPSLVCFLWPSNMWYWQYSRAFRVAIYREVRISSPGHWLGPTAPMGHDFFWYLLETHLFMHQPWLPCPFPSTVCMVSMSILFKTQLIFLEVFRDSKQHCVFSNYRKFHICTYFTALIVRNWLWASPFCIVADSKIYIAFVVVQEIVISSC